MAAVSITPANVGIASLEVSLLSGTCGETIIQGQPIYIKASDKLLYKTDANAVAAETAEATGIALTGGTVGTPIVYVSKGLMKIGGTVAIGTPYCVGPVAGEIVPYSDLVTGDRVTYLGTGATTSTINVLVNATGYLKP
jgi:hypothetical protein